MKDVGFADSFHACDLSFFHLPFVICKILVCVLCGSEKKNRDVPCRWTSGPGWLLLRQQDRLPRQCGTLHFFSRPATLRRTRLVRAGCAVFLGVPRWVPSCCSLARVSGVAPQIAQCADW